MIISLPGTPRPNYDFFAVYLFIVSSKNDLSKYAVIILRGVLWADYVCPQSSYVKAFISGRK